MGGDEGKKFAELFAKWNRKHLHKTDLRLNSPESRKLATTCSENAQNKIRKDTFKILTMWRSFEQLVKILREN